MAKTSPARSTRSLARQRGAMDAMDHSDEARLCMTKIRQLLVELTRELTELHAERACDRTLSALTKMTNAAYRHVSRISILIPQEKAEAVQPHLEAIRRLIPMPPLPGGPRLWLVHPNGRGSGCEKNDSLPSTDP